MPKVKIMIVDSDGDLLSQFYLSPMKGRDDLSSEPRLSNDIETTLSLHYEFEEVDE